MRFRPDSGGFVALGARTIALHGAAQAQHKANEVVHGGFSPIVPLE
jgi:hypothetical protein